MMMLSLLAVLALGAAAASASAHEFIVNKKPVTGAEEYEVKGTSGTSTLAIPGLVTGECKKDKVTGTIKSFGRTTATVEFTECTVVGFPSCKVAEPIKFSVNDVLVNYKATETLGDLFEPEAGSVFVRMEIKGSSCTIKGEYEVKGTQLCELPGSKEELVQHTIVCLPEGSSLKFGEKEATFEDTGTVELESGGKWSAT